MEKLKITKLFAIGIVLSMMMIASLSPVFAELEQISQTGTWQICERTHWKGMGENEGFAEWNNKTMANFTGYYATFRFSELDTLGTGWGWWENYAEKIVAVWLNFTGDTGKKIVLGIQFNKRIDLWGLIGKQQVVSYVNIDPSGYGYLGGEYRLDMLSFAGYTEVYVYKDGENLRIKVFNYQNLLENPLAMTDFTLNVTETWFNEVSFNQAVKHGGFKGNKFDGYLEHEDFSYSIGELPTEKTLGENVFDVFFRSLIQTVQVIPLWLRNTADLMYGWLKWTTTLIGGMVWSIVSTVTPFLPLLIVFYVVDAGITSVYTGSITPLGNCFLTLYNFTVALISAIVDILRTIWSFIHFW